MFQKAERKKAKLRIAFIGTAGSGKTYSSLRIAEGLTTNGKIAMIDTEAGSGELYSNICNYDIVQIKAPYNPKKYMEVIKEAEKQKYEVLIIDSLSHAWVGEGGMLDLHDKATMASRTKNSYTAWREITPLHNKLIETILQSPLHIIATIRSKTAHEIQDVNGKKVPVKIGLAPVFRDGIEYEFTVCFELTIDNHIATATKDRTSLFDGKHFVPSAETGKIFLDWFSAGKQAVTNNTEFLIKMEEFKSVLGGEEFGKFLKDFEYDDVKFINSHEEQVKIFRKLKEAVDLKATE